MTERAGVSPARAPWNISAPVAALLALLAGSLLGFAVTSTPLATIVTLLLVGALCAAILLRAETGILAFMAVASLLPFAVVPLRVVFSLTLVDVVLTTLLVSWLLSTMQRDAPLAGSGINILVLLYLGLALTSFILGLTYSISPERVRLFVKSINSTLLFFSVLNCVQTPAALRRATVALLVGGGVAALVAVGIWLLPEPVAVEALSALGFLGYPTGPQVVRPIADTNILRAIGTSVDPNVLGGLLMMAAALMAGQVFSPRPLLSRRLLWPMAALTVVALLLTQSRSAFGGLVVGVLMLGAVRDRRLVAALLILVAPMLVAPDLVVQVIPPAEVFVGRLQTGLAFQDRAAAMRLDEYANALKTIVAYPWFGIGFGETPTIDLFLGVSSIYLLIGQEMGLFGLSAFLAVLAVLAVEVVTGVRAARDEETRGILLSLAAALAAALSAGLLDHYYVNIVFPHMVALFWLYVGLAVAAAKMARG